MPLLPLCVNWTSKPLTGAWKAPCWGLGSVISLFCLHKGACILLHQEFWAPSLLPVTDSLSELYCSNISRSAVFETALTSIQLVFWRLGVYLGLFLCYFCYEIGSGHVQAYFTSLHCPPRSVVQNCSFKNQAEILFSQKHFFKLLAILWLSGFLNQTGPV